MSADIIAAPAAPNGSYTAVVCDGTPIPNYEPPAPPAPTQPPSQPSGGNRPPPPHNLQAERSLLAAALTSTDACDVVAALPPGAFYSPAHADIAQAIVDLHTADPGSVDPTTVVAKLGRHDSVDAKFLIGLQLDTPTSAGPHRYAAIITEAWQLRRLHHAATELAEAAYTADLERVEHWRAELAANVAHSDTIGWEDVAGAMRGEVPPVLPEILARTDGQALIYPGLLHWLMGEPGKGKTWVALYATAEQLQLGHHVVYLDWEGNRGIIGTRLTALGVDDHTVETYLHYWRPPLLRPAHVAGLAALADQHHASLVICDGAAKAIARQGLNEDKAADILAWLDLLATPLTEAGAAVLMLDHVTKDRDGRGLWARGSGAKQGEVSGAAWMVKPVHPFSHTQPGRLDLVQAKDREGYVGVDGDVVAQILLTPTDGRLEVTVKPPPASSGKFRPTHYMELISRAVEEMNASGVEPTTNNILTTVRGAKGHKDAALAVLIDEGFISRLPGPNRSLRHVSLLPYRSDADPASDAYRPPSTEPVEDF